MKTKIFLPEENQAIEEVCLSALFLLASTKYGFGNEKFIEPKTLLDEHNWDEFFKDPIGLESLKLFIIWRRLDSLVSTEKKENLFKYFPKEMKVIRVKAEKERDVLIPHIISEVSFFERPGFHSLF